MKTTSIKNFILLCALLGSTIFFISCGDDGDEVNLSQEIVGTWERSSSDSFGTFTERLVFRADLSGYQYFDGESPDLFSFTYSIDGNVLVINFNIDGVLQSASGTFSIDNDILSLDTDDGASITYTRISDVPADEPVSEDDSNLLVGTWVGEFDEGVEEKLVLDNNGGGYFFLEGIPDEFNYTVSDNELTFDFFLSEITVTFEVTETTLVITDPDGGVFTYTKSSDIPEALSNCDYSNIAGTYTTYSDGSSTDTQCPNAASVLNNYTSSATISYISGSEEEGSFTYEIDDSFGGMFIEWYQGAAPCYGYNETNPNTFTINVSTGEVSGTWNSFFTDENGDIVDIFPVTGSYNSCTGLLRLNWTNIFGDEGRTAIFVL